MNPISPKLTKGMITRVENGVKMARPYIFQFNPTTLPRTRKAVWADLNTPGGGGSLAMFVRVDSQEITLKLFLAHFRAGNVTSKDDTGLQPDLAEIESWTLPSLDTFISDQFQFIPPPRLFFTYGNRVWKCTARDFNCVEEEFNSKGYPTRATVTVKLKTSSQSFEELMAEMTWYQQARGEIRAHLDTSGLLV